jgi:hypothetical protein
MFKDGFDSCAAILLETKRDKLAIVKYRALLYTRHLLPGSFGELERGILTRNPYRSFLKFVKSR